MLPYVMLPVDRRTARQGDVGDSSLRRIAEVNVVVTITNDYLHDVHA